LNTETWTQWRLFTAPENTELCAQILLDAGCTGTQIDDCAVQFDESEDATIVAKTEAVVTGYLSSTGPNAEHIHEFSERVQTELQSFGIEARLESEPIDDQDWSTNWRENFPPLHIGPFLIVLSWEEVDIGDAIPIRLDPGLAFGTGQHPTTRLCLELLAEQLRQHQSTPGGGPTLLDVGCGSGVLSIAAAKLGARVTASDLDPWCTRATKENAAANEVQVEVVQEANMDWVQDKFDIVIANLMSALLIGLANDLASATRENGTLIVSGISAPRAKEVEAALNAAGFSTVLHREEDGEQRGDYTERWAAFVMTK